MNISISELKNIKNESEKLFGKNTTLSCLFKYVALTAATDEDGFIPLLFLISEEIERLVELSETLNRKIPSIECEKDFEINFSSKEFIELLRIYSAATVKDKHKILNCALEIAEAQ